MKVVHPVLPKTLRNLDAVRKVANTLFDHMVSYQGRHEHSWFGRMYSWCDHEEIALMKTIKAPMILALEKAKRKKRRNRA